MKKKRFIIALIICLVLLPVLAASADESQEVKSGVCDDGLQWDLDSEGRLKISGEGAMQDYGSSYETPWSQNKSSITAVIIVPGVTHVGNNAFEGCINLNTIELPDTIRSIGDNSFAGCTNLKRLDIPEGVTSIGRDAFNSIGVTDLFLPDSVNFLDVGAFSRCTQLNTLHLSNKLKTIPSWAFYNSSLTEVTIPEGVEILEGLSFSDNNNLKTIYLPSTITRIDKDAFASCSGIKDIYFPGSKAEADIIFFNASGNPLSDCIWHCSDGDFTRVGYPCEVQWDLDESGTLYVSGSGRMPDYNWENERPWESVNELIKKVVIAQGITYVGDGSFESCRNLTSLEMPDGLLGIGSSAFAHCSFTSLEVPDTVRWIERGAFSGCEKLLYLHLPSSLSEISDYCFDNSGITELIVPEGVTKIGSSAFSDNSSLALIHIPSSLEYIDNTAFWYCGSINEIYYSGNLADANNIKISSENIFSALWHCADGDYYGIGATSGSCGDTVNWNLDNDGVLTISGTGPMNDYESGDYRPWGAKYKSIKTVIIESGVTSVGNFAFNACSNIKSLIMNDGLLDIGSSSFRKTGIRSLRVPDSVTTINQNAFSDCTKLNELVLSRNLNTISNGAFYNTAIVESEVPEGVTAIEQNAFGSSRTLTTIRIPGSIQKIGQDSFYNCPNLAYVFFEGTKADADGIRIGANNDNLLTAIWHCSDGSYTNIGSYSGTLANGMSWSINNSEKLIISGEGEIPDYDWGEEKPWDLWNKSIKNVVIQEGITSVGSRAFRECESLVSVVFPDTLTKIGEESFSECRNLTKINLPDGLVEIGRNSFSGTDITAIFLPDSVLSIGQGAFSGCDSLRALYLNSNISDIPDDTFCDCSRLSEIYYDGYISELNSLQIGENNTTLVNSIWHCVDGDYARGLPAFGKINDDLTWRLDTTGKLTIAGYGSMPDYDWQEQCPWSEKTNIVNEVVIQSGVTSIGRSNFQYHSNLITVSIPDTIKKVGDNAFEGCSSLETLQLPGNVELGKGAFSDCRSLKSIQLPSGIKTVPEWAFYNTTLEEISFPTGVELIDRLAFNMVDSLKRIYLPRSVQKIGSNAFKDCTGITDVFYDGLRSEADAILFGKDNELIIGATWHCVDGDYRDIGARTGVCGEEVNWEFFDSGELKLFGNGNTKSFDWLEEKPWDSKAMKISCVIIQAGITSIGDLSFEAYNSITSVYLPKSLQCIGYGAFGNCVNITDVFYDGTEAEAEAIQIKNYNEELEAAIWHYNSPAESSTMVLPTGLSTIDAEAFLGTGAERIIIPDSVEIIESKAFANSTKLRELYFMGSPSVIVNDILEGCNNVKIICLKNSSPAEWAKRRGHMIVYHN